MKRAFALAMLNGGLEDGTMLPFLDGLVQAGYEGVCFHPRDGLQVPYGSVHYWRRLDALVGAALERGLDICHYDEFPYPSGMYGGMLGADDGISFVRELQFEELIPRAGPEGMVDLGPGALLAVLAFQEVDGARVGWRDVTAECGSHFDCWVWGPWHNKFYTATYNVHEEPHERASADRATMAYWPGSTPQTQDRLLVVRTRQVAGQKGLEGRPDVTLPEVTDAFLERAYRPLAQISRHHGLVDTPVFQDEVSCGTQFLWNRLVAQQWRALYGETWRLELAKLFWQGLEGWEETRITYRKLCARLLEENWFLRVANFCHANGLQMTGHLAGEESIVAHATYMGNAFRNLSHFDIPGYDIISYHLPDGINRGQATGAKVVQSAAWLAEGRPTMAEVFGANGHQLGLQESRAVLAWLALHDIVRVFDHSTYVSILGPRKYDAPPANTRFNPLALGRPMLWQWHSWFCDLLDKFAFRPRVLVVFPVESLAIFSPHEWEEWRSAAGLLETWFHTLCTYTLDVLFVTPEHLHDVLVTDTGFAFRGQEIQHLLVPPFLTLPVEVTSVLKQWEHYQGFVADIQKGHGYKTTGLKVDAPFWMPADSRLVTEELLQAQGAAWFRERMDASWEAGPTDFPLQSVRWSPDGERLHIFLNPLERELELRFHQLPGAPLTGPGQVGREPRYENEEWLISLVPGEVLVFCSDKPGGQQPVLQAPPKQVYLPCRTEIEASDRNHLALHGGKMQLADYEEVDFQPGPVSHHWKLDVPYQRESEAAYGTPYSRARLSAPLKYEVHFPLYLQDPLLDIAVLWDRESLPGNAQVFWDELGLLPEQADVLDQNNTVFRVPGTALGAGKHCLRLVCQIASAQEGALEPPRLMGPFLAEGGPDWVLRSYHGERMEQEAPSNWRQMGLPHSFGPVSYRYLFDMPALDSDQVELLLGAGTGVARVTWPDGQQQLSCFVPRILRRTFSNPAKEVVILVEWFGSWNNLLSRLNPVENGPAGPPQLVVNAREGLGSP